MNVDQENDQEIYDRMEQNLIDLSQRKRLMLSIESLLSEEQDSSAVGEV